MTPKVSQLPVCKLRPLLGLATCLTLSWKPDPRHENPVFKGVYISRTCFLDVSDCIHDGQTFSHGSIFTGADGCNTCVCNSGSDNCTNVPGCGQGKIWATS